MTLLAATSPRYVSPLIGIRENGEGFCEMPNGFTSTKLTRELKRQKLLEKSKLKPKQKLYLKINAILRIFNNLSINNYSQQNYLII